MKLKKWLSVFLAATMMVSVLPEPGKTAYASEILENAEDGTGLETDADSAEEQEESLQMKKMNAGGVKKLPLKRKQ